MFKGRITYRECGKLQALELKHDSAFKLLEVLAELTDLDIVEIHIHKEV